MARNETCLLSGSVDKETKKIEVRRLKVDSALQRGRLLDYWSERFARLMSDSCSTIPQQFLFLLLLAKRSIALTRELSNLGNLYDHQWIAESMSILWNKLIWRHLYIAIGVVRIRKAWVSVRVDCFLYNVWRISRLANSRYRYYSLQPKLDINFCRYTWETIAGDKI